MESGYLTVSMTLGTYKFKHKGKKIHRIEQFIGEWHEMVACHSEGLRFKYAQGSFVGIILCLYK